MVHRLAPKIALALIAPVVVLAALEGACRIAGVRATHVERPFLDFDLGWTAVTGDQPRYFRRHPTRFFEPRPDVRGIARTDRMGLRGPDHPERHARMLRVAVVGDSSTFGFGVRYGDSFVGLLEAALRHAYPNADVDVIDAGCYAYSSYQNEVDLKERVLPLHPDVVVLAMSGFNDGVGAVGFPDETWGAYSRGDDDVVTRALRHSRLAAGVERLLSPLARDLLIGDPAQAVAAVQSGGSPSGRRVPVDGFERNLRDMLALIRASGAAPVLFAHHPTATEAQRDPYLTEYAAATRRIAAAEAVPFLDGASRLDPADEDRYYDKIHPTEEGHQLLADGLFDLLDDQPQVQACRDLSPMRDAPTITALSLDSTYATGGEVLTILGSGLGRLSAPRFFIGGEPADIRNHEGDARVEIVVPPLAPGLADVVVQTRSGSYRAQATLHVTGPELEVRTDRRRAIVAITARAGDLYRLDVATAAARRPMQLGRFYDLAEGTLYPTTIRGQIPASGTAELEVPLPGGSFSTLYIQALVEPPDGDYPRVMLPTNMASLTGE